MTSDAWASLPSNKQSNSMLRPQIGGSVQAVRSTTGGLGVDDKTERKVVPINPPPEVEVEETK